MPPNQIALNEAFASTISSDPQNSFSFLLQYKSHLNMIFSEHYERLVMLLVEKQEIEALEDIYEFYQENNIRLGNFDLNLTHWTYNVQSVNVLVKILGYQHRLHDQVKLAGKVPYLGV